MFCPCCSSADKEKSRACLVIVKNSCELKIPRDRWFSESSNRKFNLIFSKSLVLMSLYFGGVAKIVGVEDFQILTEVEPLQEFCIIKCDYFKIFEEN